MGGDAYQGYAVLLCTADDHGVGSYLDIVAQLPVVNGLVLIGLSVLLTLIGGFIPSKQAAKKDPVIALRSE